MRRNFSKIVLLATGVLMLAITLLPHHHHLCYGVETIHFTTAQNCEDYVREFAKEHDHQSKECDHQDTNCDLRQLFVMSNRAQLEQHNCACHDHESHIAHLYVLSFANQFPDNIDLFGAKTYEGPPMAAHLCSEILESDINRRGPPCFVA